MAGKVVHFEIPVDDGARACEFYATAFRWDFEQWGSMDYWTTSAGEGDGIGGALVRREDGMTGPTFYIEVSDISDALSAVASAGGRPVTERMPIPGVGWLAMFVDTEGNRVGIFEPDPSAPMPSEPA